MADRFYSEGSKNNGAAGSDANAAGPRPQNTNPYSKSPSKGLGDFSENIDSNVKGAGFPQTQKKFEVHINDFDNFVGMPEPPVTPKAPRPINQVQKTTPPAQKRAVPPTAPRKPATAQKPSGVTSKPTRPAKPMAEVSATKPPKAPIKNIASNIIPKRKPQKSATPQRQYTPEQRAKLQAKKRYNLLKTALIACVCVFFISIMTVSASTIAMQFINDILVIDKQGGSVSVEIPEGSKFDDVFDIMESRGLIKQKILC